MSDSPNLEKLICPQCSTELGAVDNFCAHCGQPTERGSAGNTGVSDAVETVAAEVVKERLPGGQRLLHDRTYLLVMLFLVLGPLAFPALWRCRMFTALQKVVLTLLVIVLTVVLLWLIWYIWIHWIIEPFRAEFFSAVSDAVIPG